MDFLKNNKRFSFKLGGGNIWDSDYTSEVTENGNTIISTCYFAGGFKVTNAAKKYEKHGAYEWVNYIENTSDVPAEIISDFQCSYQALMKNLM